MAGSRYSGDVSADVLRRLVEARLPEGGRAWWQAATTGAVDEPRVLAAWSGAGRRLGRAPITLTGDERARLGGAREAFDPEGRPLVEAGRLGLLLSALDRLPVDKHVPLVEELYRTGDLDEKCILLRGLGLLPDPMRFLSVAAEGIRSNAAQVLEAIACDNPYPRAHLAETAWNQMVMKVVFVGLPLPRVPGLAERRNPELARMARDFAAERRAAGRPVPADLPLIAGDETT